ncbi:DUF5063 domain-containing protein [uncultured Acetobacteroides sp.]|uniref:DUF5063 domain-containing protein n=1 Tax=uncultured Acetobacteroides sp. TaxID=1760811 RepID=UPI0029F4F75B|nr:DUF5063 domain-containing protein [uncultured Acetobacteroides sp.]
MSEQQNALIYSKNVVEVVTLAKEYTAFLERAGEYEQYEFLIHAQKLLPLIYLKGCLLPDVEQLFDEEVEKFVSETDWTYIRNNVAELLGDRDDFYEVYTEKLFDTEGGEQLSISETLADIYQDLKDFLELYRFGNEECINDALYELKNSFTEYWGYKSVIALKAIHRAIYFGTETENDEEAQAPKGGFFNRFQDSHRNID